MLVRDHECFHDDVELTKIKLIIIYNSYSFFFFSFFDSCELFDFNKIRRRRRNRVRTNKLINRII